MDEVFDAFCKICVSRIRDPEDIGYLTVCGHTFHPICLKSLAEITTRLTFTPKCPICLATYAATDIKPAFVGVQGEDPPEWNVEALNSRNASSLAYNPSLEIEQGLRNLHALENENNYNAGILSNINELCVYAKAQVEAHDAALAQMRANSAQADERMAELQARIANLAEELAHIPGFTSN